MTKTCGTALVTAFAVGSARGAALARARALGATLAVDGTGEAAVGAEADGTVVHAASRHARTRSVTPRALPVMFAAYRPRSTEMSLSALVDEALRDYLAALKRKKGR